MKTGDKVKLNGEQFGKYNGRLAVIMPNGKRHSSYGHDFRVMVCNGLNKEFYLFVNESDLTFVE